MNREYGRWICCLDLKINTHIILPLWIHGYNYLLCILSKSPSTNIEWNGFCLYLGPQFEPIKICSSFEDVSHIDLPVQHGTGSTCSRLLPSRRICSVEGRWCLGLWLLGAWEVVCLYLQIWGAYIPLRDKVFEAILQGQFGRRLRHQVWPMWFKDSERWSYVHKQKGAIESVWTDWI